MENTYGIGVANRYALFLDEEEDPLEVLKIQELERETKRKSKILEKEKVKSAEPKVKPAAIKKASKDTQNVKVASTRPTEREPAKPKDESTKTKVNAKNVKFIGDGRDERNNRRNRDEKFISAGDVNREGPREGQGQRPRNEGGDDRRGRGIGPRGTGARGTGYRGMRGNRVGPENRFKRDFDRQPPTDKTELQPPSEVPVTDWVAEPHPAATELVAGDPIAIPTATEGEPENVVPVEEEPQELTLDEYKALRSSRQKPTYNLRKAGEGEDLTQWNNMYALAKKKEEDEPDEEEVAEYDVLEYPQRVGRQKHLLNIEFHFTDGRRGSRGRGGTGRGSRGAGGSRGVGAPGPRSARGGPRGDHQGIPSRGERGGREPRGNRGSGDHALVHSRGGRQSAPKVDDELHFPSLG